MLNLYTAFIQAVPGSKEEEEFASKIDEINKKLLECPSAELLAFIELEKVNGIQSEGSLEEAKLPF